MMTPDGISFDLTKDACISIREGQVMLLIKDDWTNLTRTNFGKFLMESMLASAARPESACQEPLTIQ